MTAVALLTYPTDASNTSESLWQNMTLSPNGVVAGVNNRCNVIGDSTGMHVKVDTGRVKIGNFFGDVQSLQTIPISNPDASNPRIDRIVAELNLSGPAAQISLVVLPGTPALSPTAPPLGTFDIALAKVLVPPLPNATVTSGNVTLERSFVGTLGPLPFATIYNVTAGSSFFIANADTQVAEVLFRDMYASIFIQAQVALGGANPGTLLVGLPNFAYHDNVLFRCDYAGDIYRCGTSAGIGTTLIGAAAVNPQANQTFATDGVSRTLLIEGEYRMEPF